MDFNKFDNRTLADNGFRVVLKNPQTGEPLGDDDDEKAPAVIVRGTSSREANKRLQAAQNDMAKEPKSIEDLHKRMMRVADHYIVEIQNVEIEGKPCKGENQQERRKFLDLTFPIFDNRENNEGEMKMELINFPFAKQIIDAAGNYERWLGNSESS